MAKINGQGTTDIYENVINYISGCTRGELLQLEMRRMDDAAQMQKQLKVLIGELVRASSEALLARALRMNRKAKAITESTSIARELLADVMPALPEVKAHAKAKKS
jgi:hypothetical protein